MVTPTFDLDAAPATLREGKDLSGKNGNLTPLSKQLTETAMKAELDEHLGKSRLLILKPQGFPYVQNYSQLN